MNTACLDPPADRFIGTAETVGVGVDIYRRDGRDGYLDESHASGTAS